MSIATSKKQFFTGSLALLNLVCFLVWYEADTKTLSCRCRLFLLFGQDLRTPIGQQWYQVIEKQKKSTRVSHREEHDQESFGISLVCVETGFEDKSPGTSQVPGKESHLVPFSFTHKEATWAEFYFVVLVPPPARPILYS